MSILFSCPHCSYDIKAAEQYAGRPTRCPGCAEIVTIPAASESLASDAYAGNGEHVVAESPAAAAVNYNWADHHDDDDEHGEDHGSNAPLIPPKGHVHEDLIDMTPMVDIVFFLLIFFMTTSMTALQAVMDLPTPQTATDKGAAKSVSDVSQDKDTLIVTIKEDDTFWIDEDQILSDQDLRNKIREKRDEAGSGGLSLIVVGNSDASHGAAVRVLDAGAGAGVNSLSLLVKDETDE